MSICLCNHSADEFLEYAARKGYGLTSASPDTSAFKVDLGIAESLLSELEEWLSRPLELLVDSARKRVVSSGVSCHVWNGSVPQGSFYMIEEGIYVTTPSLTLFHQASQLHQAELCQMLGRYTGTWTPAPEERNGQATRAPLVSPAELETYLGGIKSERGKGNLRLAMAYTCEGAASAPETSLQLALGLPYELNGLGMPMSLMNYEVDLSQKSRELFPHDSIRVDLCWPHAKFGLEYQGEEHGQQLGEDYARWFAARAEGYELWLLAKEQLQSAVQLDHIGREVAARIGFEIDEELWPSKDDFQELLDTLTGKRHPKPVGYNELRKRQAKARAHLRKRAKKRD